MATDTYYIIDGIDGNGFNPLQYNGSAPTSPVTTATGWTVKKTAATSYALLSSWNTLVTTFATTVAPASTDSPANVGVSGHISPQISGIYRAGNWIFSWSMISSGANIGAGALTFRVWKGPNANASGAVEITSGIGMQTSSVISPTTTTAATATVTVSMPEISLNNEFLFVVVAWKITTAASSTSAGVRFRSSDGTNAKFTTTEFVPHIAEIDAEYPDYNLEHVLWKQRQTRLFHPAYQLASITTFTPILASALWTNVSKSVGSSTAAFSSSVVSFTTTASIAAQRLVLLEVGYVRAGSPTTGDTDDLTTVSIGGVAMTRAKARTTGNGSSSPCASLWYLFTTSTIASGATVSITSSGTASNNCVANVSVWNWAAGYTPLLDGTATGSDTTASTPSSLAITATLTAPRMWARGAACVPLGSPASQTDTSGFADLVHFTTSGALTIAGYASEYSLPVANASSVTSSFSFTSLTGIPWASVGVGFALLPNQQPVIAPDSVWRPQLPADAQQAYAGPVLPPVQIFSPSVVYPDRTPAPAALHPRHQDVARNLVPERVSALADVNYPHKVDRPTLRAVDQQHVTEIAPAPERTAALADVNYPERAPRPALHVSQQQDVTKTPPAPERTAPLADVSFPHKVERPAFPAHDQQDAPHLWPVPETTSVPTYGLRVTAPERVPRAWFATAEQSYFASPVAPERTAPITSVEAPERAPRPTFPAHQQQTATTEPPLPEGVLPLDWQPTYPERAPRAWLATSNQPTWTTSPAPERTAPIATVEAPVRVERPAFAAVRQQDAPHLPPLPEITSDATKAWRPSFDDINPRVGRWPWLHVAQHDVGGRFQVVPLFPPPPTEGFAYFPDRAPAPLALHPRHQDASRANLVPIAPPPPAPTEGYAVFPDRVPAAASLHPRHQASSAFAPVPEAPLELDARAEYPPAVRRAWLAPNLQQHTAAPVAPERTAIVLQAIAPDTIRAPERRPAGAVVAPTDTPAVTFLAPVSAEMPRRIERRQDPQIAFVPEATQQAPLLSWLPVYEDGVTFLEAWRRAATAIASLDAHVYPFVASDAVVTGLAFAETSDAPAFRTTSGLALVDATTAAASVEAFAVGTNRRAVVSYAELSRGFFTVIAETTKR